MILNNENKDASHYLSKFAHLIRITLDHSSQSLVSFRETLEYLERYIEMEQIRNNRFTYAIIKDDALDLDETLIPPMLIQPFIENALWHGVSPGNKDIHIRIEFKREEDNLVCIINDNGIGINQSLKEKSDSGVFHKPVGISNIRNRIALLNEKYDLGCSIVIKDKSELNVAGQIGTLVTIRLPLQIKGNE
jgi:sensor histidine kinase YesM